MKILYLLSILFFSLSVRAQDLVYKSKNPAFGGDTFNYQWLLNSADSQNLFKDPQSVNSYQQKTELQRFTENLNGQLLNQLSRSLFQDKFGIGVGSASMPEGTYVFGSLSVDIYNSSNGLVVDILDITTGEQTQVVIP